MTAEEACASGQVAVVHELAEGHDVADPTAVLHRRGWLVRYHQAVLTRCPDDLAHPPVQLLAVLDRGLVEAVRERAEWKPVHLDGPAEARIVLVAVGMQRTGE